MKLYYNQIIVILDEDKYEGTHLYLDVVPHNTDIAPHNCGISIETLEIEHTLQSIFYKFGIAENFKKWYQEEYATSDQDPFYPTHKCAVTKNIYAFVDETDPGIEIFIHLAEIDVSVEIKG